MKITRAHLEFWRQHQSEPAWAKGVAEKQKKVSVHSLIPTGHPDHDKHYKKSNFINILKLSKRTSGKSYMTSIRRFASFLYEPPDVSAKQYKMLSKRILRKRRKAQCRKP